MREREWRGRGGWTGTTLFLNLGIRLVPLAIFKHLFSLGSIYLFTPLYLGGGKKREEKRKESLGTSCQEAENLKGYINQGKSTLSTLHNFHAEKNVKRMKKSTLSKSLEAC